MSTQLEAIHRELEHVLEAFIPDRRLTVNPLQALNALAALEQRLAETPAATLDDLTLKIGYILECLDLASDHPVWDCLSALQAGNGQQARRLLVDHLAALKTDPLWEPAYGQVLESALTDLKRLAPWPKPGPSNARRAPRPPAKSPGN
jgi:hypothetical protein